MVLSLYFFFLYVHHLGAAAAAGVEAPREMTHLPRGRCGFWPSKPEEHWHKGGVLGYSGNKTSRQMTALRLVCFLIDLWSKYEANVLTVYYKRSSVQTPAAADNLKDAMVTPGSAPLCWDCLAPNRACSGWGRFEETPGGSLFSLCFLKVPFLFPLNAQALLWAVGLALFAVMSQDSPGTANTFYLCSLQ